MQSNEVQDVPLVDPEFIIQALMDPSSPFHEAASLAFEQAHRAQKERDAQQERISQESADRCAQQDTTDQEKVVESVDVDGDGGECRRGSGDHDQGSVDCSHDNENHDESLDDGFRRFGDSDEDRRVVEHEDDAGGSSDSESHHVLRVERTETDASEREMVLEYHDISSDDDIMIPQPLSREDIGSDSSFAHYDQTLDHGYERVELDPEVPMKVDHWFVRGESDSDAMYVPRGVTELGLGIFNFKSKPGGYGYLLINPDAQVLLQGVLLHSSNKPITVRFTHSVKLEVGEIDHSSVYLSREPFDILGDPRLSFSDPEWKKFQDVKWFFVSTGKTGRQRQRKLPKLFNDFGGIPFTLASGFFSPPQKIVIDAPAQFVSADLAATWSETSLVDNCWLKEWMGK